MNGGVKVRRIGIYGGSFNPPHIGHIRAAEHAARQLGLDRVLLIPDHTSPGKQEAVGSPSPAQRLEMVSLALPKNGVLEVCDLAVNSGGIMYTCDVVDRLCAQYPDAQMYLLMGSDMLVRFPKWLYADRICQKANIAVFLRGDPGEREALRSQKTALEEIGAKIDILENPQIQISSTQLRRMLAFGCATEFLAPDVAGYIEENGLYGYKTGKYRALSMEDLEQTVVSLLKPGRVAHVLGCRDTAVELARRWGADEIDAARAGLLHDITKALDGPLQLTLCQEYGITLGAFSAANPKTLHALTGALVAERVFGEERAVVNAIRHHTTGKAGMNMLEKIIYVADYMEPNRDFPGVERLRQLAFSDIDSAFKLGLEMTISLLKQQGRTISSESLEALAYLNETF